jgi:predicted transposase YdaD
MKVKIMLNTNITLKETRVYREIKEEGREEVREVMANSISLQLTKRFGELSGEIRSSISGLPLAVLQDLSAAVLDFNSVADLESWLAGRIN